MGPVRREFFPRVPKTVIPRPAPRVERFIPGQRGSVWASRAAIYGPNWYHDPVEDLIEIWDAGPALCFKDVLPPKNLYAKEDLYLRLSLAYRTTLNAFVNIRTFSGNHITLSNDGQGAMYVDPFTRFWVTDDCTININSLHHGERIWIQRVDWEWVSQETIFEDELTFGDPYLIRTPEEVAARYAKKTIDDDTVKQLLVDKLREDDAFAKRCLLLLGEGRLLSNPLVGLHELLIKTSE